MKELCIKVTNSLLQARLYFGQSVLSSFALEISSFTLYVPLSGAIKTTPL